jgi:ribokinase
VSAGKEGVAILGVFVADLAFRAVRMPVIGETIFGSGFKMGPGGKGSNQSVAAARVGAKVTFVTKIGRDAFGDIALATWKREGIAARAIQSDSEPTGAAFIYVNDTSGENAIIVYPGAGGALTPADVDAAADAIRGARVFVTQLEQPTATARHALGMAKAAGVATVFNPAPAAPVEDAVYPLCDYVVPNETEAAALTGLPLDSLDGARRAGDALLAKGAGTALIARRRALFHAATAHCSFRPSTPGRWWRRPAPATPSAASRRCARQLAGGDAPAAPWRDLRDAPARVPRSPRWKR